MDYEKLWDNLRAEAKVDMDYQRSLEEVRKTEEAYLAVCACLTPDQKEIIEAYISACEELGDSMTLLAYRLGRSV